MKKQIAAMSFLTVFLAVMFFSVYPPLGSHAQTASQIDVAIQKAVGPGAGASVPFALTTRVLIDASGTVLESAGTIAQYTAAITADNQSYAPAAQTFTQFTSDNATGTNRTVVLSITGAIAGRVYVLVAPATNAVEIADSGTATLSAAWTPDASDTLSLLFTGTFFLEVARSAN